MAAKKKGSFLKKIIISIFAVVVLGGGATLYWAYQNIYQPNVTLNGKQETFIYIPTGSTMQDVVNILYENNLVVKRNTFEWLAEQKNYQNNIHPGKYRITDGMSNNDLINLLRSGDQEEVKVTFNNIRFDYELAAKVSMNIEADSASIMQLLNSPEFLDRYGLSPQTKMTLFIPNTYRLYWATTAEELFDRMAQEYKKFWTEERKKRAKEIGLTQSEVSTLASIVQEETYVTLEQPKVAGLYINRVKKGWLLQADPTLKFCANDFTITRVLNEHKKIDCPHNTYMYPGIPPGPIVLPEISALDAVLNYEKHDYMYMCGKGDGSGTHNFAKTYTQHRINANRYRQIFNK